MSIEITVVLVSWQTRLIGHTAQCDDKCAQALCEHDALPALKL